MSRSPSPNQTPKQAAHAAYMRQWYQTEAGQRHLASEERRATVRRASTKWAKANPEKTRVLVSRRRARLKGAEGTATAAQVQARVQYWGERCWICKGPYEEIDHYKPLSAKGSNWPANLRPVCKSCNVKKYDFYPYTGIETRRKVPA